jgi:hypothetical protein
MRRRRNARVRESKRFLDGVRLAPYLLGMTKLGGRIYIGCLASAMPAFYRMGLAKLRGFA